MNLYALFEKQSDVSATTKAIKQADEEADITVFEGAVDLTAATEATLLAVPAAATTTPLIFDEIFPSSSLNADAKAFIGRRLQDGASAVRIETDNADAVRSIVRKHNGQVWPPD